MSWHVETEVLEGYASGSADDAHAFSIEAHVLACADCRARMSKLVEPERVERMWAEVEDRLDAPRPTYVERLLRRAGASDHVARLLAATPSLSLSWLGAVAL